MKNLGLMLVFLAVILVLLGLYIKSSSTNSNAMSNDKYSDSSLQTPPTGTAASSPAPANGKLSPPAMTIDQNKKYTAVMKTSAGDITIELNAKETPKTVNNFVYLARQKFYDNTIFHRVIKGFMIQGGDPQGTGAGGPGYRFDDEQFTGEYTRGTIAMANAGPNTNGSQFFIMHQDYPLPPSYVIFGKVTTGLEVVDKIAAGKTGPSDRPVDPVVIKSVEISAK